MANLYSLNKIIQLAGSLFTSQVVNYGRLNLPGVTVFDLQKETKETFDCNLFLPFISWFIKIEGDAADYITPRKGQL